MYKRDHPKTKITAFVLLNLLLCTVFFILSAIPDRGMYMRSWHLELFLIYYPLTAVIYGAAAVLTAFGDRVYAALMGVIFLAVAVLNALTMGVVALPAAFVYTGIMLAAAVIAALVKAALCAYVQYRNYKKSKENHHV